MKQGNRINLLYDEDSKMGLLRLVPEIFNQSQGVTLSRYSGQKSATPAYMISIERTSMYPDLSRLTILDNVVVKNEGILFDWPTLPPPPPPPEETITIGENTYKLVT